MNIYFIIFKTIQYVKLIKELYSHNKTAEDILCVNKIYHQVYCNLGCLTYWLHTSVFVEWMFYFNKSFINLVEPNSIWFRASKPCSFGIFCNIVVFIATMLPRLSAFTHGPRAINSIQVPRLKHARNIALHYKYIWNLLSEGLVGKIPASVLGHTYNNLNLPLKSRIIVIFGGCRWYIVVFIWY